VPGTWRRFRWFLEYGLWQEDPAAAGPRRRLAMRLLRLLVALAWEYEDRGLGLRATGLVYTTLLSLVPFLAVAFSVLKAFGAHQQVAPLLDRAFEPLGEEGHLVTQQVVGFVDRLRVGVLGTLGLAGLFFTVISLLGKVEDAFNHVWRVRRARPLARKFTDYLSIVLVGPVLVFSAVALTASVQSSWAMQRLLAIGAVGAYVVPVAGRVLPLAFLCLAFTFLYRFMPYTRVALGSALAGGVTAAVLWQVTEVAFTAFVARSPGYAAVYSGLAILVVFLIWLNAAWVIVLVGAEVAYLHQHPPGALTPLLRHGASELYRERLALLALIAVTRRYLAGGPPWRIADLAADLHAPASSVDDLVEALTRQGILLRVAEPAGVALGRPPEAVTAAEVLEAVRGRTGDDGATGEGRDDPVASLLARRDEVVRQTVAAVTLRTLALGAAGSPPAVAPPDR
jgi:membrane protein